MKQAASASMLFTAAVLLAGCGETRLTDMLGAGKSSAPGNISVRSNQNLAMPPDLRLPPPGTGSSEAQSGAIANEALPAGEPEAAEAAAVTAPPAVSAATPPKPAADIYERYGISKFHPDGKPKTEGQLQAELKKAYLAKKRQTDPNYGTIWNLGSVFRDG